MRLAFYAPMKPPDHPVPSGDRTIARALLAALAHMGAEVTVASHLRSRDGTGDAQRQTEIVADAQREIARLIDVGGQAGWAGWITYHNYYKAPDLIGPAVTRALGIPYLQIESTRAQKRLSGPWARFARAAEAATDAAATVFYFTTRDAQSLRRDAPAGQHLIHLAPFLNRATLPAASTLSGPMLSVGMMRAGDKLASYRIIADTLALLPSDAWHLDIAGDGPARCHVEALMAPFGPRVRFLGECDADMLQAHYARTSLLFWPGVNEALGLALIEAQAAGLPVVAQDRPGMNEMLSPGDYPTPESGPAALAQALAHLLHDPALRQERAAQARACVADRHLLPQAAATLAQGLALAGVRP